MTAINTAIAVISKPKLNKEYKRVLTASNSDSLDLDSDITITGELNITINVASLAFNVLLSDDTASNSIALDANGSVNLTVVGGGTGTGAGALSMGVNTIKVRRDGAVNRLSVNGGSEFSILGDPLVFNTFASRLTSFYNIEVIEFDANGKTVSLNEGNGDTFKSDDGTITGTVETIHLNGLNYINLDVIKPI